MPVVIRRSLVMLVLGAAFSFVSLAWAGQAESADNNEPTTWADGRFFVTSPGYYTATRGEIGVSFREVLPWGSRVQLHFGWGGSMLDQSRCPGCTFGWYTPGTVEAAAVAPYTWSAYVDRALHERGHDFWINKLQFVWIVTDPEGGVRYVRGNETSLGYFEAKLPEPGTVQTRDRDQSQFQRLQLSTVKAN